MDRRTVVVTGATATGKTALAVEIALRTGAEVVSMDSRQVYRGMDIGTAKPTLAERRGVPHHGLDVVSPAERYSAGRFARDAHGWLAEIHARGAPALLVGGTGFFLRALTEPLFGEPPMPVERREALKRYLEGVPDDRLLAWARRLDGEAGPADRQRLARRIEVATLTGHPLHWWQRAAPADVSALDPAVFVLDMPRPDLCARIDARVEDMVRRGLVDEVRALRAAGFGEADPGMSATGYPEILGFLEGRIALAEAVAQIQRATRQYARRQVTWFRHQLPAHAVRLDAQRPRAELADRIVRFMSEEATV